MEITNPDFIQTKGQTKIDVIETGDPNRPITVKRYESEDDAKRIAAAAAAEGYWLAVQQIGTAVYLTPPFT